MHETDPLEKQLQSWTPRRPSAEIGRRLFAATAPARRVHSWGWLTPLAACALTLLIAIQGVSRRAAPMDIQDNRQLFATLMFDSAASNVQQNFILSKVDENVEWNVWPHPSLPLTNH